MKEEIAKAIEVLKAGGIILYPTDTVWGIGCDATNYEAVQKVYELKKNEDKKSMLVLVENLDKVMLYVDKVPSVAWDILELTEKPTTLILPNAKNVAKNIIPEEGTLGIRIPNHEFCKQLLFKFHRPLVSTSANISGTPAPKKLKEVSKEIIDGVDMVINTKFEGQPTNRPSSIIMLDTNSRVKIIR
ncbi:MAG: threonylcarbamoyl-AMP synthase [Bacteroidetes bacterium]|nr:threonylcarbamoyl-AMP synthase [Bacteroidota bacterium]